MSKEIVVCTECFGDLYTWEEPDPAGKIPCSGCNGTGRQYEIVEYLIFERDSGKEIVVCSDCNGHGAFGEFECLYCEGSGLRNKKVEYKPFDNEPHPVRC